jgi:sulfite reductase (NADPH) flavoprotein alpha-component
MNLHIPTTAPFTVDQRTWLDGFFAGLDLAKERYAAPAATMTVDILYGSQTGNAETVAEDLAGALRAGGLGATTAELDSAGTGALLSGNHVVIVTSTYGEGDMPDNAGLFWEALSATDAPRLDSLRYAVLALGDSGYDDFCQAGRDIDIRLEQLGGTRTAARVDCDVDFEDVAAHWSEGLVASLVAEAPAGTGAPAGQSASAGSAGASDRPRWNRKNPFPARLVTNRLLSGDGSAKEIRHLEFDLADSGITYQAGDALNVMPVNDPALVDALLGHLGLDGTTPVDGTPLQEVLLRHREIRSPSRDLIAALAELDPRSDLADVVRRDDRAALDSFLWGRDVLDLLTGSAGSTPPAWDAATLVGLLRPLQARQYSISSSPLAHPHSIHLTVAAVRHGTSGGREHGGVCSTYLADRVGDGDVTGIWLQPNTSFSVPADSDRPVIMVGPGTGIAPFRGFLHERASSGAAGGNWLFFGDQHESTDAIYGDELADLSGRGVLTTLSTAYSRDQAEKVYVQDRMRQEAAELFRWLEDGAYFYVCGDASRMARDVEDALLEIIAGQSGCDADGAADYLAALKKDKRYVRDVY